MVRKLNDTAILPLVCVSLGVLNFLLLAGLSVFGLPAALFSALTATTVQVLSLARWVFPDWGERVPTRPKKQKSVELARAQTRLWACVIDYGCYGMVAAFLVGLMCDLFGTGHELLVWTILGTPCVAILLQDRYPKLGMGKRLLGLKCISSGPNPKRACTARESLLRNVCPFAFVVLTLLLAAPPGVAADIAVAYPYLFLLVFWLSDIPIRKRHGRGTIDIITRTVVVRKR